MIEQNQEIYDQAFGIESAAKIANMTIGDQIQEISKRLQNISEELHQQVREKHGALLQQATHAGRFDSALNALADDVQRIRTFGHRVKAQVDSQYQLVENQTKVLGRLHELSHLFRSAGILLALTNKLKSTKDVLKQAEIHYELAPLVEDEDLKEIEFIQNERIYVISGRQKINNLTQMQLVTGLQDRNELLVVNALKVFMNLNTLEICLENLMTTFLSNLEQSIKECFAGNDITVLNKNDMSKSPTSGKTKSNNTTALRGPGKTPQLATTQNFRAKFWKSLHWLIYDELFEICEQIRLLKRSLEAVNQFDYSDKHENTVEYRFWQAVQDLFRKSFAECSAHVGQTLQEGLSKLLTSVRGFEYRLNGEFVFNNNIFSPLEVGYVSKCAANMKSCLAGVDLPSNETIDNFMRVVATELSAALIDKHLATSTAAIFMACGKELCTKLSAQIKIGPDLKNVNDVPNIQQLQNTLIANILFYYKDSVRRMVDDLGDQFVKLQSNIDSDILKSLDQPDLLISTILQQIFDCIISNISRYLLSMHREPDLNKKLISGPSMYMLELQEFLLHVWTNHVEAFDDKVMINKCGQALVKRVIELFIHNVSIIRPLSSLGRQRLKNDCMYMEKVLNAICPNLSDLGDVARLLRTIPFLITLEPEKLVEQSLASDSLVPSYIILFILFGYAGADLQSPHTTLNWSNERLIEWLEGHTSEREKLELISGALERYRDDIRRKKKKEYDVLYPLMVEIFEKADRMCKSSPQ